MFKRIAFVISLLASVPFYATEQVTAATTQTNDYAAKKQRWDEMAREVDTWADALGMPIDADIKDTIIVLNLLGFKTDQSCGGHFAWGRLYPWISFATYDAEEQLLLNQAQELSCKIDETEKAVIARHPELSVSEALQLELSDESSVEAYHVRNAAWDKFQKYRKLRMAPIYNLLMEFYKDGANPDTMITCECVYDIASVGGSWQSIRDDATKAAKLKEYQAEMRRFTGFLIDMYYNNK